MGDVKTGHLNQQITLRKFVSTGVDAAGAATVTTSDFGPIWAMVEFVKTGSGESEIAKQVTSVTSVDFTVRNTPERMYESTNQVLYRGKKYEVRTVQEVVDTKRHFLVLRTQQMGLNQVE